MFLYKLSLNHFASVDVYTRKTFPNCKTEGVYTHFGRHAIFLESTRSRLGDPAQTALQTTIEYPLFVDFCLIPLSNTCSFVRPARNVNREIFLPCQEGFCVGKFGRVVDQAVLDNQPLRMHFRRSRLHYKKKGTAQNLAIENSKCQWENAFILVSLRSFFDMKNN